MCVCAAACQGPSFVSPLPAILNSRLLLHSWLKAADGLLVVCACVVLCVCVCVGWGMEGGGDISELILGSLFIGGDTGDAVCTEQGWDLCLRSKSALVSGQGQCEEVRVDTFLSICQSLSRTCSIRTLHSLNQKGEPEGLDCFIFSNTARVYFTNTITGKFHMTFLSFTTGMR